MDDNEKVFSSKIVITNNEKRFNNNLYDLLSIIPAKPLELKKNNQYTCDFIPKTDKVYVPKKRSRVKVKTVRDVRSSFESDTYTYLNSDIQAQENYLLKKIRDGCSRNENTIKIANKILRATAPISRAAWQMLININPEDHIYPRQFVVYNGKLIQVNGSYGGNNKLISSCDLVSTKSALKVKKKVIINNKQNKKKGLLQNSLAIKFKPGPLRKKKFLDDSHQKYQGDIELLDLPKVGLVLQPSYGTVLEPTITHFLSDLRTKDGTISAKWAEFAVSVLGKHSNSNTKLVSNECMTFDLKYKCDQRRILMRKDLDNSFNGPTLINMTNQNKNAISNEHIIPEIKDMMHMILDAVEIHVNQDKMFAANESLECTFEDSISSDIATFSKDKNRRKYCELGRLDVTVIQLPENSDKKPSQSCGQAFCSLGCICDSLKGMYKLRAHCGREGCMFDCKCDFSKYTSYNSLKEEEIGLLPGIINIEDEINLRLAKEEQKFHQTIIVTGEKNILFKTEKRNWKSSKKYETFYKNMCLKNVNEKEKRKRMLTISLLKLNCENVEPWCMVHNLYKCFCKGTFTESTIVPTYKNVAGDQIIEEPGVEAESSLDTVENFAKTGLVKQFMKKRLRQDTILEDKLMKLKSFAEKPNNESVPTTDLGLLEKRRKTENCGAYVDKIDENKSVSESSDSMDCNYSENDDTCSRLNSYKGRKYSDEHYKNTNNKIKDMEENDKTLQIRLMNILNIESEEENKINNVNKTSVKCLNTENSASQNDLTHINDMVITSNYGDKSKISLLKSRNLSSGNKLVSWLESNYKLYKKRIDQGLFKTSLEPPKIGKVALHSWDFILSRYRDRKNLFLISKQIPYRIFMGVHTRNPFFASCMNINEIRFADLHKYPQTVKNLLTNATDLKDNFCILRGLAHCWELVGSVTKVNKNDETTEEINDESSDIDSTIPSNYSDIQSSSDEQSFSVNIDTIEQHTLVKENQNTAGHLNEAESSKWFIMTVENDFSEIRFYKKGFFVKYESIVKAINVARMSGKAVRLSSQKCIDKNSGPQFGVYAIPNTNEYCVFIGPYEMQDSLGIETIKSIINVRKTKRTRGFWINTNKIDNLKVIDNPLLFMPLQNNVTIPLDSNCDDNNLNHQDTPESLHGKEIKDTSNNALLKSTVKKTVRPIKIRKTNGFYHLATDGMLKKFALQSPQKVVSISAPSLKTKLTAATNLMARRSSLFETVTENSINGSDVEKAPPLKISAVYSQKDDLNNKKIERGMFILKPEEINRKLFEGNLNADATSPPQDEINVEDALPNFALTKYPILQDDSENSVTFPFKLNTDVFIISDDEEDIVTMASTSGDRWKNVLLKCENFTQLGSVYARQKSDSHFISFKVPNGDYSDFYTEKEAFQKLNLALSSMINESKPLDLDWSVIDSIDKDQGELTILDCDILHRVFKERTNPSAESDELPIKSISQVKTYSKKNIAQTPSLKNKDKKAVPATAEEDT